MTPYYQDDAVTIYHGDCRDVLPQIEGDVVVTDPPYGVGVDYGRFDDTRESVATLVAEVVPSLVAQFTNVAITPGVANMRLYPEPSWTLCWFDAGGVGSSRWGFCTWQPILVYGPDPYLAAGLGRRPDGLNLMQRGDPDRDVDHPCPKPIGVMRWLVGRVSVRPKDVIVDPFAGSGTTLRAAKDLGHRAVGIESEERFCEIAAKRCGQEVLALA